MDSTEAYEYFADHLRSLARLLFPEKQRLPRSVSAPNDRKSPPWWTEECFRAILSRRNAAKIYQQCLSVENFLSRKKERYALEFYVRLRRGNGRNSWGYSTVRLLPVTDGVKAFKRRNLSEPSNVISDDRQNF